MKSQSEQVMQQHVAIWRFLGFWPLPTDRFYHKIFFAYMRLTCIILFPLCMTLAIPEAKNVDELTNVLMPVTVGFLASAKSICIIWNNRRIKQLFGIMVQLDSARAVGGPEDITRANHFKQSIARVEGNDELLAHDKYSMCHSIHGTGTFLYGRRDCLAVSVSMVLEG